MTLAITHAFVSAKGDGTDATLVKPSNWNAAHATSMANNNFLGNTSGGVGPIQELALSTFMAAAMAAPDAPTFLALLGIGAFGTGDCKFAINPTAAPGWIVYQGGTATIGDGSSTATVLHDPSASALFQLIWNQISSPTANAWCPVIGGLGASAAADFAAHKQITLPWFSGRTLIGAGAGGVLTSRVLGVQGGEENHTMTINEIVSHRHAVFLFDQGHVHQFTGTFGGLGAGASAALAGYSSAGSSALVQSNVTGLQVRDATAGGGTQNQTALTGSTQPFNVMQPYNPMWVHLKL